MIHISHSEFVENITSQHLIQLVNIERISATNSQFSGNAITQSAELYYHHYHSLIYLAHSRFVENSVTSSVLYLDGIMTTVN